MAILKMKRLRLMVVRSQKEQLLRELACHGCVEFSEIGEEISKDGLDDVLSRESSKLMTLRTQLASVNHAIALLDKAAPAKGKLLSAKPEAEDEVLLDASGLAAALSVSDNILGLDDKLKRISAEESRQRSLIESLQPWRELDMPLDTEGTQRCSVLMGSIPVRISVGEVSAAIESTSDEAELFLVSQDKAQSYVVIVCIKEALAAVQECLRGFGFTAASLGGMKGSAKECTLRANEALRDLAREKESCAAALVDEAVHRQELKLAADRLSTQIALAEAEEKLYGTGSTLIMEGWMPAEREQELARLFDEYECAWDSRDPEPEEYPEVPVKLKNNPLTNGLNMVTDMYSLPAYDGVDPNPLMAPFFILFYGLMMADMGYGLLMIIAAVVAMAKIKPRRGSLSFCQLLFWGGISTFIMGALTGGFFGNALEQIGKILGMPEGWGVLPNLFNPMTDSMMVLIGAMALGIIHLNAGMVISAVEKVKKGDAAGALWEEGALWVTLVGIVLFALNKAASIGNATVGTVVLVIGIVMVLFGGTRSAKGVGGKLLSVFSTVYNVVTGWFGDILSYSRIMALMLAGSVIATVFNTIGGIANSLWLFIPVFLIGHALNFGLNLLGCYVHDLRLQCLEYFGKFYKDGGRAFAPLEIKTKYYNTVE